MLISCNSKSNIKQAEQENRSNFLMNKADTVQLSKSHLDKISVSDIIFAEYAETGAMGNQGEIIFFILEEEKMICYETSFYTNKNLYIEASELLLKHQKGIKNNKVQNEELLFDYHYGGMGNHVFFNKNKPLKKKESFFLYEKNGKSYPIFTSVPGVFNAVNYSIENLRTNKE